MSDGFVASSGPGARGGYEVPCSLRAVLGGGPSRSLVDPCLKAAGPTAVVLVQSFGAEQIVHKPLWLKLSTARIGLKLVCVPASVFIGYQPHSLSIFAVAGAWV